MKKIGLTTIATLWSFLLGFTSENPTLIYKFEIKRNIDQPAWRLTQKALDEAIAKKANLVLIELNTYGGW